MQPVNILINVISYIKVLGGMDDAQIIFCFQFLCKHGSCGLNVSIAVASQLLQCPIRII